VVVRQLATSSGPYASGTARGVTETARRCLILLCDLPRKMEGRLAAAARMVGAKSSKQSSMDTHNRP
jgi:hypothetical protein